MCSVEFYSKTIITSKWRIFFTTGGHSMIIDAEMLSVFFNLPTDGISDFYSVFSEVVSTALRGFSLSGDEMLLHSTLASLPHGISLACDVWHNKDWWQFICVTAHWIDNDWSMQTRVLNFKLLDLDIDTPGGISKPIMESIDSWGIKDKIFSMTSDGDCEFSGETEVLKNLINPIFGRKLFHGKCVSGVFHTCIQETFEVVGKHVQQIKLGIGRIHVWLQSYYDVCAKYGMKPKVFMVDIDDDWDSSRRMLKSCIPYRDVMNEFIALSWPGDDSYTINEHDWEITSVLCRILDVFYEAVDCISRSYYPSSSEILLSLVNIVKLFAEYQGNFVFEEKFSAMEDNFLKHFE